MAGGCLNLPWSPSSVGGIRARAWAYDRLGVLKGPTDRVVAKELMLQGLVLFEKIGDEAGAAMCISNLGNTSTVAGDPETGRPETLEALARFQACGDAQCVAWSSRRSACRATYTVRRTLASVSEGLGSSPCPAGSRSDTGLAMTNS